ncbi:MAG TPA: hypothetical protein VMI92_07465 [Steroidobacteraceae bacterium]|nr:hypothetical protein [Steroidobacteraceae bacterium]
MSRLRIAPVLLITALGAAAALAPAHAAGTDSAAPVVATKGTGKASDAVRLALEGPWGSATNGLAIKPADGKPLPLRAEARRQYAANQAAKARGENSFDDTARCLPPGIPRLYTEDGVFRIAIGERLAGMYFDTNHLFRLITMNKPHFEAIAPGYQGQAVGHWEGNTLVLDSNQFNDATLLDDTGLPHSDQLQLRERLSVGADGKLHIAMTITDPKTFTRPFVTNFVFEKHIGALPTEDYCLQRRGLLPKSDAGAH